MELRTFGVFLLYKSQRVERCRWSSVLLGAESKGSVERMKRDRGGACYEA